MLGNVGSIDRIVRFGIAVLLVLAIIFKLATGIGAIVAGALAVIMVATATMKFCPLYWPFKISTQSKKSD